jgi:hypothetical protein
MQDYDPLSDLMAVVVGALIFTIVIDVILIASDPSVFQQ